MVSWVDELKIIDSISEKAGLLSVARHRPDTPGTLGNLHIPETKVITSLI